MLEAASGIPIRLGSPCVTVEVQPDRVIARLLPGAAYGYGRDLPG
jgi:hypothetical protein